MGASVSKLKHELRSCRIAYHEHLQTGTTTTRKEKAKAKKASACNNDNGDKIATLKGPETNIYSDSKTKNKRIITLTLATKDADSFSDWSGDTLIGDEKTCRR